MNHQEKHVDAGATPPADENAPVEGAGEEVAVAETDQPSLGHDSVESLQEALDKAEAQVKENWNLYLSAQAELQNFRKRTERELHNAHKFALEKFIVELLPVKDSLEMGIVAATESDNIAKLREGSELTLKMLATALDKSGVEEIDPQGDKFNPELHEAMAMQPSDQSEPNTVLQVIQKGYRLNERLIRPAMVIVAQAVKKE
jgi:molecular chaperone GrpE